MSIKIISYDQIPFDELTKDYMFAQKMTFRPVIPFDSPIVAQSGGEDALGNVYMYQEWANGKKAFLLRHVTGNPPMNHVKSNYDIVPVQ